MALSLSDWYYMMTALESLALTPLYPPLLQEAAFHRGVEPGASPQGYPFYLPIRSPPRSYSFPSSMFISQTREKPVSPEPSMDAQLACRWMKVHLFANVICLVVYKYFNTSLCHSNLADINKSICCASNPTLYSRHSFCNELTIEGQEEPADITLTTKWCCIQKVESWQPQKKWHNLWCCSALIFAWNVRIYSSVCIILSWLPKRSKSTISGILRTK